MGHSQSRRLVLYQQMVRQGRNLTGIRSPELGLSLPQAGNAPL